jgi:hypothetical protein
VPAPSTRIAAGAGRLSVPNGIGPVPALERSMRWKTALLGSSFAVLTGCASAPLPAVELDQARHALEVARSSPNAAAARAELEAAEAAVAYAEFEQRESPADPLNSFRARQARLRAYQARAASFRSSR